MKSIKRGDTEWNVLLIHGAYFLENADGERIGPFYSTGQIAEWSGTSPKADTDDSVTDPDKPGEAK